MQGAQGPADSLRTGASPFRLRRDSAWLLLLALGELADIATTRFGMGHGTFEVNPVSAWLLSRGFLEIVKIAAVAAMVLVALLVVRFASRADTARATSMRKWSFRGMQVSVWALTGGTLMNLGMWALEAVMA